MIKNIEQQSDFSHKMLYSHLRGVDLPTFVKEAELDEFDAFQGLPKTAFADQNRKLFPINSKSRVYISNAYVVKQSSALKNEFGLNYVNTVKGNIKLAAEVFGITKELEDFEKIAYDPVEQSHSVVVKVDDNDIEIYQIKTASEAAQAADHFKNYVNSYPFEWRRKIASDLVDIAKSFNLEEVPDLVCKYAGMFYPAPELISDELERRATKLASADHVLMYMELGQAAKKATDIEDFFKIAEACYEIEKLENIKPKVARLLGDPVDKIFSIDFNKIASIIDVIKIGDEMFSRQDLEAIPSDIYNQAFGVDLDPKTSEAKDILPTMPRSDLALFKELSGIKAI